MKRVRVSKGRRTIVIASAIIGSVVGIAPFAAGSPAPKLQTASPQGFKGALGTSSHLLYLLSNEKGGALKCSGSCLKEWPPLLVKDSVKTVSFGKGVDGTIGFVKRGHGEKQVTFNSYPVYTYAGDKSATQHHGEGLSSDGGTWYLVKAGASSPSGSSLKPATPPPTTTTTHPTTPTTQPSAPTTTTTHPAPPTTTTTHPTTPTTQPSAPPIAY